MAAPPKICAACGREIAFRRRWRSCWAQVRYCGRGCRNASRSLERRLERAVLDELSERAAGATVCPSEIARKVEPGAWRRIMEPVRRAARRLADQGRIEILQRGRPVDAASFRGPIRLRAVR